MIDTIGEIYSLLKNLYNLLKNITISSRSNSPYDINNIVCNSVLFVQTMDLCTCANPLFFCKY